MLYNTEDNSETTLLDDNSANGGSMCWSKDGKEIYYHSVKLFKTPFKIKRINLETQENVTLLEAANNSYGFFHPEAY